MSIVNRGYLPKNIQFLVNYQNKTHYHFCIKPLYILVVPGVGKYISIIAQLERKAGKETMFTASLKEMIAKYNAFLFSKALINNLLNQIKENITKNSGNL